MSKLGLVGGIDAGGTTFKCVIADRSGNIIARQRVPTSDPYITIERCVQFFQEQPKLINALGIGSFGPLDTDTESPTYGTILKTPKQNWSLIPIKSAFKEALGVPVTIDTDVNAALLAEQLTGAARGCSDAAYITVGTGIGAGICIAGRVISAPAHPEFGHIRMKRHPLDHDFPGVCPFHKDCLEGLASATAFEARYGDPRLLSQDHDGWRVEAYYLAQACINLVLTLRLTRVLLGGGLMQSPILIPLVREAFLKLNADYIPLANTDVADLIQPPEHASGAGVQGAIELALSS